MPSRSCSQFLRATFQLQCRYHQMKVTEEIRSCPATRLRSSGSPFCPWLARFRTASQRLRRQSVPLFDVDSWNSATRGSGITHASVAAVSRWVSNGRTRRREETTSCCVHCDRSPSDLLLLLTLTADIEMRISARRYCKSQYTNYNTVSIDSATAWQR